MKIVNDNARFNQLLSEGRPLFVKFYADWCSDCKNIEPALDELLPAYEGKIELKLQY